MIEMNGWAESAGLSSETAGLAPSAAALSSEDTVAGQLDRLCERLGCSYTRRTVARGVRIALVRSSAQDDDEVVTSETGETTAAAVAALVARFEEA